METRDMALALVMVVSVIVFSYEWLSEFWGQSNSLIVLSAITLIGSLALLILSLNAKLDKIEKNMDKKERSLRYNIQSLEEDIENQLKTIKKKL